MPITRRAVLHGIAVGLVAGCGAPMSPSAPQATYRPVPNAAYDAWAAAFRARASASGISASTISRAFRGTGYLPEVVERDRNQTEFKRSLDDYLAIAASDERIEKGRANAQRHGAVLSRIMQEYDVEPHVVTAIWGLESRYGERRGSVPVIGATSTLAFDGRRGAFFEKQLVSALQILENGDVSPDRMVGSWAGAMGHTQFIPTTYQAYAVDFTGDGRRDIWADDPTDGLASAAAYVSRSGWRQGQPWGLEVTLPAEFSGPFGRSSTRPVSEWLGQGVRDARGASIPDHGPASIIIPAGRTGPAFMTFRNFTVLTRYNNSENYVIGVGHLSDRIAGQGPLVGTFPPDANGLTRADRKAIQAGLTRRGFDTGGTDGVIGRKTEAAIRAFEQSNGLPITGQATRSLLRQLS